MELDAILEAVSVRSVEATPPELIERLSDFLYRECYIIAFGTQPDEAVDGDITASLQAAHPGSACRDGGWRIEQVLEHGEILARKSGFARRIKPGEYILVDRNFGSLSEDLLVRICLPKDSITVQDQYYFAFGETASPYEDGYRQIRFYFNVSADDAPELVTLVVRNFNRFQIPFQLKLLRHRERYQRRDSAVLYVAQKDYTISAMLVARIHEQIGARLRDATPLFTKRLARGLALAEDPSESFGKNRCRILAHALLAASENGSDPRQELERQFQQHGLSLDRPYLNRGSTDRYEFPCS